MKVLIGMESSGKVREAFRARGHEAYSLDLLAADDGSPYHIQAEIKSFLGENPDWDLIGFHPSCTYLSGSGLHWNNRGRGWEKTNEALDMVRWCMGFTCKWYLENPVGIISTRIRKPDQIIQPYQFGEDASKKTCLWLNGLTKLDIAPSLRVPGRIVNGKERWGNQTDSGQNKLTPSDLRWKERSKTYQGIADAMARKWG